MSPRTLILAALFLLLAAAPAAAQAPQASPYVDGPVTSLLVDGDTLYVGGTFAVAGTGAGPLSFASPDGGRILRSQRGFSGGATLHVRALLADGSGGWYVGGQFERVDGRPRGSLVRLLADGSVHEDFHVDLAGPVRALARHGSTLWVGGDEALVAVDAASGARLALYPVDWRAIEDLEVSGERLYAVGAGGLTSLDARTGRRDGWPTRATDVEDVAVRDGIVYVAETDGAVALRESDASLATRFPVAHGDAIEAADGVVIIRGGSTLGAFDPVSGTDRGWFDEATVDGPIAISGSHLYAAERDGGAFASFDLRDGSPVSWTPPLRGGEVNTLQAGNGVVGIGGAPAAIDGIARSNLAAFDLRTGAVKPFAPDLPGPVRALHRVDGVLYAGGSFPHHLAALDAITGARLEFPEAAAPVQALTHVGDTLFVGGAGGVLGAVSRSSRTALPWAPSLGCDVDALAAVGTTLHAGGCFGLRSFRELAPVPGPTVAGRVRALRADEAGGLWVGGEFAGGNLAHFDAGGAPLVDSPVTDGPVHALALEGTTLHIGGVFERVQDAPRSKVGQVNLIGGSVAAFNPRPTDGVTALAPLPGGGVALGGSFGSTWDATTGGLAVFAERTSVPVVRPKVRPAPQPTRPKGVPPRRWRR